MRMMVGSALLASTLLFMPLNAMAQGEGSTTAPGASNLKGPPNANGFGHAQDAGTAGGSANGQAGSEGDAPSATNLKGPPNANGFRK